MAVQPTSNCEEEAPEKDKRLNEGMLARGTPMVMETEHEYILCVGAFTEVLEWATLDVYRTIKI